MVILKFIFVYNLFKQNLYPIYTLRIYIYMYIYIYIYYIDIIN